MTALPTHSVPVNPPGTQAGFTLVELMVALVIFAILSAAGVALLTSSATAQAAVAERLEEVAALRRTSSLIAADLAAAVPRATREPSGLRRPAFVGNAPGDQGGLLFSFVRSGWSNLDQAPRGTLQKLEYRYADGRLERVAFAGVDAVETDPPAVIAEGIERFAVRYRGPEGWADRWEALGDRPMPSAVEIVIGRAGRADLRQLFLVGAGR